MVPEGWRALQFGDVATFRNGLNFLKDSGGEQIRVVGIPHFWQRHTMTSFEEIAPSSVGRLNDDDYLQSGDLLFVRSNGNKDLIGRCMYFPSVEERLSFSGFTIRGRVDRSAVLPDFAAALMQTRQVKDQISRGGGGTNISNLSQAILSSIIVPLPPLPEQKKIAEILSTWDEAIETTEKLLANAEAQKRALMQQLLTGKRRLSGLEGQDWTSLHLFELGETYGGLSGKSAKDFGEGEPYIPYMAVFSNSRIATENLPLVSLRPNERQNCVRYGDILFTTSSETPEEIGMASVLLDEVGPVYLNSFCFGFRLYDFRALAPQFARFLFRGEEFRRDIRHLAQGATRYNLSKRRLVQLRVSLPSVGEQLRIVEILERADQEVEGYRIQMTKLHTEKRALMQQLLTGKRRVKV